MTLSSEAIAVPESRERRPAGRGARVLRGTAVERAQPAALHVERPRGEAPTRRRSPAEELGQARQDGYDEGYLAGQRAALSAAEQARGDALHTAAEALRRAATAVEAGRANAIAVVEADAAALAVELTRALIDRELSLSDEEVTGAVRRALRLTSAGEDLVVRLHPDEAVEPDVLEPFVTDCKVTVVADPAIERGGCVIDAGPCRIDAQIEPALARVRTALLAATPVEP
jgi:flagellar assembly protein FliH